MKKNDRKLLAWIDGRIDKARTAKSGFISRGEYLDAACLSDIERFLVEFRSEFLRRRDA